MDSKQIRSQRNSIYDALRELDKERDRLDNELIDLQAQCPHENRRQHNPIFWYCQDCDYEHTETTEDEATG